MAGDLQEKIYNHAPIWLQHILISVKGWEFRYRREIPAIKAEHYNFLLQSQKWTTEQFRTYQTQQLQEMLRTAFAHVPFYHKLQKKLKCEPEDFKTPEDIRLLPILEKNQVRGQEHLFINETIDLKKCYKGTTSGTTGTPLVFYYPPETLSRAMAFVSRLRSWAGISDPLLPKRAQFTGRNIIPTRQDINKEVYWRRNIPGNALLFSTTHISPDTAPAYAKALQRFHPELIDGYPSALLAIARVSRRLGLSLKGPQAIIVTAETIWPEQKRELEDAYGCRVFNQYSAAEPTAFWCDCEYGVMHSNPESGITEIVDAEDNPVDVGKSGTILHTAFFSPVTMLIRYRIGDLAVRGPETLCQCGRHMPRIEALEGRIDDILFVPERGYVGRFSPAFKGLSHIVEAQIIQEELDLIRVKLVTETGFTETIQHHLLENLQARLGQKVKIIIDLVPYIPRGPNGKFNAVISKIKHLYPDRM